MIAAWIGTLVGIYYIGYALSTDTEWEVAEDGEQEQVLDEGADR